MPLPDRLARRNRRLTNPVFRAFAGGLPPFGLVVHRGRRSGRAYRTPVVAFPDGEGFVIALTYGPDRDWVRNVRAAGGCTPIRGGREIPLVAPAIVGEAEGLPLLPRPVRTVLPRLGVTAFLRRHPGGGGPGGASARP
jgi:deazaflavin-dependent oxidoreductase (nitroreductase family)